MNGVGARTYVYPLRTLAFLALLLGHIGIQCKIPGVACCDIYVASTWLVRIKGYIQVKIVWRLSPMVQW